MEAVGKAFNLPISRKYSVELGRNIKGLTVEEALAYLEDIINLKRPIRLTKYNRGVAHKKGIGPGKYPVKVAKYVKQVLINAKNNAEQKGIDISTAKVYLQALKGQTIPHGGRKIGTRRKATHIIITVKGKLKKDNKENKVVSEEQNKGGEKQ
jgi:large subunit ribosomal protein L22